jgi:transcription initiation factor IIE alpha subunit
MVELREAQNDFESIVRRFVRSFYPATEVVLVDYLVNAGYALTAGAIADHLGVEKTQVKKGLEARLLPDLILEKEIVGTNLEAEEYYRLSPFLPAVLIHRFTKMEATLTESNPNLESFVCDPCGLEFATMEVVETGFRCKACAGSLDQRNNTHKAQQNERLKAMYEEHVRPLRRLIETNLMRKNRFLVFPRFPVCGQYSSALISQVQIDKEPDNEPTQLVRPDFVGAWLADLNVRFEIGGHDLPMSSDTLSFQDRQNIRVSQALTQPVEIQTPSKPVASLEDLKKYWNTPRVWPKGS